MDLIVSSVVTQAKDAGLQLDLITYVNTIRKCSAAADALTWSKQMITSKRRSASCCNSGTDTETAAMAAATAALQLYHGEQHHIIGMVNVYMKTTECRIQRFL